MFKLWDSQWEARRARSTRQRSRQAHHDNQIIISMDCWFRFQIHPSVIYYHITYPLVRIVLVRWRGWILVYIRFLPHVSLHPLINCVRSLILWLYRLIARFFCCYTLTQKIPVARIATTVVHTLYRITTGRPSVTVLKDSLDRNVKQVRGERGEEKTNFLV